MGGWSRAASAIVAATLVAGCGDPSPILCGGAPCPSERTVTNTFQTSENNQLDILFVVDDTSAIAPYATALANGLVEMAAVLRGLPDVPSLHVGFVPTSVCADAASSRGAECGLPSPIQYLRSETCRQVTNFAGTLDSAFSCLGDFGESGCAPAQPFAAIERTLSQPLPGWEGFLRPTAQLAIVVLTASEDASGPAAAPDPVSRTVDFLRGLKVDPASQILVSMIGPADCTATADPGVVPPRLLAFAESFGANALYYPVCADHFGPALATVVQRLDVLIKPPCFERVRDIDPATPGLQPECVVTDTVAQPDGSSTTTLLPSCDQSSPPCWSLRSGAGSIGCGDKLVVSVDHGSSYCPDNVVRTRFECVGCLDPNDPACAQPQ
jgi:hypothetical protein